MCSRKKTEHINTMKIYGWIGNSYFNFEQKVDPNR